MTLQQKTILGVGVLFGAFALVIVSISQTLLSKSYSELEQDQARLQVRYLRDGFNELGQEATSYAQALASSRPIASFIANPASMPEIATRYLTPRQLSQQGIHLLVLADIDGNIRLSSYQDPQLPGTELISSGDFAMLLNTVRQNFIAGQPRTVRGLYRFKSQDITLFIQAEPVVSAERNNLNAGVAIVGRKITSGEITTLRTVDQNRIQYAFADDVPQDSGWREAIAAFEKGEESFIKIKDDNTLSIYATLRDLQGKPQLNIRVDTTRTFFERGRETLRLFMILTISFGILAIILSYSFLERYLIWRIRVLGNQLATIRRKKNSTLRLTVTGKDELGTLTEDINQTLASLDEEQTQREQAQREHKTIIDSLKEVIFRIDTDGKWTYLNPAWKDLTGYSERETLEQYFGKSVYVDDLPQAQELITSLVEGQIESGNIEVRYHTKSGAVRWVQLFARVIREGKGDITGVTGTLFDVTERINTEKKLRESEQLYRLVSENSTDVIFRLTLQGDILYTSRACVSILGYTPEELNNTWIYDHCHPDDSMRVQKAYQRILEKGVVQTIEHQIRQKNGQYLWVESVGKPITDDSGRPIVDANGRLQELIVTTRDITERKNNERQLLLREKALASASCGVLISDALQPDAPVIYANTGFTRMTSYSSDEAIGRQSFFLGGAQTDAKAAESLRKGLGQASQIEETLLCYRKDGSTFWSRYAIAPLYDKGGRLTHFISILTDVSDIKEIQSELEKAKDAAESANRAKSEFLAVMSHEIRTPMNAVIGFAELLSNTPLNDEQREFLSTINSSANALLVTINDILDFSKVEAGKLELDPQPTVLSQVVEEAIMQVKPKADAKGLKLSYNIPESVPAIVVVDGTRLKQILLNLLSNASKFTQKGGIHIEVKHDSLDERHARLYFEVTDTGIGIPEDKIKKLFQSFSQVDSSTTRKYGGTGLGLAICKKFCELMEGSIAVASTYGKGSTFKFNIKVAIDPEMLTPPIATVIGASTTVTATTVAPIPAAKRSAITHSPFAAKNASTDTQPYRLLVVEDNPANQLVLLKMLCQMNLSADVANNGKEAMELWMKSPYHVVLTDLQMPEMDGLELTGALRKQEKQLGGSPTHIIGVTANVLPEYRDSCLKAGMDDFLTKPLKMDSLKRALEKYKPAKA
jgi:PAS domain S-box-containing protein